MRGRRLGTQHPQDCLHDVLMLLQCFIERSGRVALVVPHLHSGNARHEQQSLPGARFGRTAKARRDRHSGFFQQRAAKDQVVPGHPARPIAAVEHLDGPVLLIEDVEPFPTWRNRAGFHISTRGREQESDCLLPPGIVDVANPVVMLGTLNDRQVFRSG